jgi:hypothetical protein
MPGIVGQQVKRRPQLAAGIVGLHKIYPVNLNAETRRTPRHAEGFSAFSLRALRLCVGPPVAASWRYTSQIEMAWSSDFSASRTGLYS